MLSLGVCGFCAGSSISDVQLLLLVVYLGGCDVVMLGVVCGYCLGICC